MNWDNPFFFFNNYHFIFVFFFTESIRGPLADPEANNFEQYSFVFLFLLRGFWHVSNSVYVKQMGWCFIKYLKHCHLLLLLFFFLIKYCTQKIAVLVLWFLSDGPNPWRETHVPSFDCVWRRRLLPLVSHISDDRSRELKRLKFLNDPIF